MFLQCQQGFQLYFILLDNENKKILKPMLTQNLSILTRLDKCSVYILPISKAHTQRFEKHFFWPLMFFMSFMFVS